MNDFDKKFEQIVSGLNIDDRPNAEHKKALRQQMLTAHKEDPSKKTAPRIQPVWSKIMKSNITKSAAAAIILIGAFIFLTQSNGISTAFANAMEQFASAQTARFDLTIEYEDQKPQTSSFLYDAKGYIRQNMADGTVNFVDYNINKVISFLPGEKTAIIREVKQKDFHSALYGVFTQLQDLIQQVIDLGYGSVESLGTKTINGRSAYGFFIETTGQSPGLFWQGKGTLTVWADAETNFPVLLKWHHSMTDIVVTVSNIELNVVLDPEETTVTIPKGYTFIDESIPPKKDSVEQDPETESETVSSSFSQTDETQQKSLEDLTSGLEKNDKTLITFFHSWIALSKSKFPSSLAVDAIKDIDPDAEIKFEQKLWSTEFSVNMPNLFGGWKPDIDPNNYTQEEREQAKNNEGPFYQELQKQLNEHFQTYKPLIGNIVEGFTLVNALPAKSDWHYNGVGIEFGDAETAIFWYLPEGSENYRVIFGDLTIEDVAPEDIPLLETSAEEDETDQIAKEVLETAIQLGADIPKDKRPIVLRMLTLKEKDLIKGLAVWLELLDGKYPNSLEAEAAIKQSNDLLKEKYYVNNQPKKEMQKELKEKTYDLFFASAFYDKLIREKKDVVYYGDKITVENSDKILIRWKIKKDQYRVVLGNLTSKTVAAEELAKLEKQSKD